MTEAYLKGRLSKLLREELRGAVVYRHEDKFTSGIPDLSVTWEGRTVWLEVKLDRPGRRSKVSAIQRLAIRGLRALLVTYGTGADGRKWTRIEWPDDTRVLVDGFNHAYVKNAIITAVSAQHMCPGCLPEGGLVNG